MASKEGKHKINEYKDKYNDSSDNINNLKNTSITQITIKQIQEEIKEEEHR